MAVDKPHDVPAAQKPDKHVHTGGAGGILPGLAIRRTSFKIGHLGDALGLLWVPSSSMGRKELAVEDGSQDATRARERSPPKGVMTIAILGVI